VPDAQRLGSLRTRRGEEEQRKPSNRHRRYVSHQT
jgi:hypothetical protein